jgi:hypothetical protein
MWDTGGMFNKIKDPCILTACATSSKVNKDNPSFDTATHGPFQVHFWKAMYNKLVTLIQELDCCDYVPWTPDMEVLPSTWAFKIKRYPDGRIKKFKAQFCMRGNRQKEGVAYFETWAPVMQWSKVRIVMILAIKLDLISIQYGITAAFIHGQVPPTETRYVRQTRGFMVRESALTAKNFIWLETITTIFVSLFDRVPGETMSHCIKTWPMLIHEQNTHHDNIC